MKITKFYFNRTVYICILSFFFFSCNKENANKTFSGGENTILTSGGVTLAGNQNSFILTGEGEKSTPKVKMEKRAYIINFKYKGSGGEQFEVYLPRRNPGLPPLSLAPFMGFAKDNSGWLTESKILQWEGNKSDVSFNIKASTPWVIDFKKFPIKDVPLQIPATLNGSGSHVTKLISLRKGIVNFDISCPNTRKAGFMVTLYDGNTGQHVLPQIIIASNVEAGKTHLK